MAELSRFFNSVNGDRRYLAEEFAEYFAQFLTNGVYHTNFIPTLAVNTVGTDLNVYVEPGSALINGYMYKNTTNKVLRIEDADPVLDRIDRVVIRMNRNQEARNITAQILTGTPAQTPTPPMLTRDSYIYEISIAQVYVTKGASYIGVENITDERLDSSVCGIVKSLITDSIAVINNESTGVQYTLNLDEDGVYLKEV